MLRVIFKKYFSDQSIKMRLSGYQPQYFPRLHYFNRALDSDVFEISDYIQYVRKHAYPTSSGKLKRGKSYQSHTPIKLAAGVFDLSIPVHDQILPINKTQISYSDNWVNKHLASIETGYRKSTNFSKIYPEIEVLLKKKYTNLASLTIYTILWGLLRLLTDENIEIEKLSVASVNMLLPKNKVFRLKKIFIASESPVPPPDKGKANDWIIALCKYANADEYFYGGTSGSAYMDLDAFKKANITTALQDWHCQVYSQQYKKVGFIPNLSIIDLVMNLPLQDRQKIIR